MRKFFKYLFFGLLALAILGWLTGGNNTEPAATSNTVTAISEPIVEEAPELEILKHNPTYEPVTQTITIHTRVRNNSTELMNYVGLKATFYDKKGNIVGTGMGNAANLAAGATKTIDVMGMGIENSDRYEVEIDGSFSGL